MSDPGRLFCQRGGDPCSRKYIGRCEAMRKDPPGPEWDGVFEMKTK